MQPEVALATREQMLHDGYCFAENILTEDFLQELREETERLIAAHEPPPDVKFQGQHVGVHEDDNDVIRRLLAWEPTWQALEELGFGDFESTGSIIILTKDPGEPALYWHQDWMNWNDGTDQRYALAAADICVLLSERHNRREWLSQGDTGQPSQAIPSA